jgi:DNA-binding cell septation regulator SpoVG
VKVSKLIKDLQEMNPNEEIIVAYWDRKVVNSYIEDSCKPISESQWNKIVADVGNDLLGFEEEEVGETLTNMAMEVAEPLDEEGEI